jgi:hypothetical protein
MLAETIAETGGGWSRTKVIMRKACLAKCLPSRQLHDLPMVVDYRGCYSAWTMRIKSANKFDRLR